MRTVHRRLDSPQTEHRTRNDWKTTTHLIFSMTPVGTPTVIDMASELCSDTLRSTPYSTMAPNVPALQRSEQIDNDHQ